MLAIKNWFLEKQGYSPARIEDFKTTDLTIVKETDKAVLVTWMWKDTGIWYEMWVPKSCLCEKWETQTSPFAYHDYLVIVYRTKYRYDRFVHQWRTKELIEVLTKHEIDFMSFDDWKNR